MKIRHLPYTINPETDRFAFYENYWKDVSLRLLLKHLRPQGQTVLDYGCGRGESLQVFGEAGFQVTGADVDPECVRLASRFGKSTILDPVNPVAQFGPKSFDVVACFHVLEHVENPKQTLNQLREISRKYLLLAVPNLRYLHRLFSKDFRLEDINEGHLQSWDHWHFRNLAERHCGLRLVEWGTDATMLPLVSQIANKALGPRGAIWLETGLFRRIFPFHGISIIGLFERSEG